jgi:phage-related tail protein
MKTFYLRRSDCLNYSLASGEHGKEEIMAKHNMVIEAIESLGGVAEKQNELIEKVREIAKCSPTEAQRMIKSCADAGMLEERVHGAVSRIICGMRAANPRQCRRVTIQ